jgi:cellulose synthase/poly-beta-1,6-N-acetylglucosamine synthase-like glycosyltransferase
MEPGSLRKMIANFADESVGVVSGELLIRPGSSRDQSNIGLYWKYESWIRDRLGKLDSMFGATGPFYIMRRELACRIPEDILLDDVYLPMRAFFAGYRLIVEPTARAVDYPTTLETEFKRKVRTLAGNYQLMLALPQLLGPANRMWFHFVSYKLGRLLLPYALIAIAASSFFLPAPISSIAVGAQIVFYGLSFANGFVPENSSLKRLASPACTFVTMMVAILCGLSVFFIDPRTLWRETKVALPETSKEHSSAGAD